MSEQVSSEEKRPDLVCDCYADDPPLWGPACSDFCDNDMGFCVNCGHGEDCHEHS